MGDDGYALKVFLDGLVHLANCVLASVSCPDGGDGGDDVEGLVGN